MSPSRPQKYVLIVDRTGGPLAALAPRLKRLDFRVILLPTKDLAVEFVRSFPKLALVAVNESMDPGRGHLRTSIRALEPSMPLISLGGESPRTEDPFSYAVSESVSAEELSAIAEEVLRQRFYPSDLVEELIEAATTSLRSFGNYVSVGSPFLRASGSQLAPVSSVIAFSGERLAGHLVVGSDERYLKQAYLRMFPEDRNPELTAIVDFLGEVCNRTLGRVKSYFESRGVPFVLGVPLGMQGNFALVKATTAPSLGLDLEGLGGRLFVEFCFERFNPDDLSRATDAQLMESGKVVFL